MLRKFARDRAGVTAVEFAFIATPFFLIVMMVFEVALFLLAQQSLDFATKVAARQIMTGKVAANSQSASSFATDLICPKLGFGLNCNAVVVNAYKINLTSDETTGTGIYQFIDKSQKKLRPAESSPSFCLGGANDTIFLDISYKFETGVASYINMLAANGATGLRTTTLFRNEPFPSGGASC